MGRWKRENDTEWEREGESINCITAAAPTTAADYEMLAKDAQ